MTENEAKYILNEIMELDDSMAQYSLTYMKAMEVAIKALEEVQWYRKIGTPEECRAVMTVKKEVQEIVDRQLVAGKNNYKETYDCFWEIVKVVQANY